MHRQNMPIPGVIGWLLTRVGVIYVIGLLFCLTCIDFKALKIRVELRHLNDSIPNFTDLIVFEKDQNTGIDWKPYKDYFELILRYMPDDVITKQLLGYADYYSGKEQKAIDLFKSSSDIQGHPLFWSNYNLGVIYYKKGLWPQAAESLLKAIASSPPLSVLLMHNSMVYKQMSASPFFKFSLSQGVMDAQSQAYILLLSSFYHMGQYDKLVYIADLAANNPDLFYKDAFYYYAGLGFLAQGQTEKAYLCLEKSLSLEKNNPDVYYYIADIYERAGQLPQAKQFLQASYLLHQKNDPRFPYESHVSLRFF